MKIFIAVLLAVIVSSFVLWETLLVSLISSSTSEKGGVGTVLIDVPKGSTLGGVSQELSRKGLIKRPRLFRLYARVKGQSFGLKVGEYEIPKNSHPREILKILTSGKSKLYSVTFPEGANIFEMAAAIEKTGRLSGKEFLARVKDSQDAQKILGQPFLSLEGYLFPETYNFTKYTTIDELIRNMVNRFESVYAEVSQGYSGPMNKHQIVTLASVIEKETGAPEERPLISSVFHNRLQKGMRLQSDPTIIYGYWFKTGTPLRNIRKSDILAASDHNTYTVNALPVGPVANPGKEALKAAMFPATSEHLYFVSRNDGTHVFTNTYKDHLKAVKDFQLNPKAREGKSWRDLNR